MDAGFNSEAILTMLQAARAASLYTEEIRHSKSFRNKFYLKEDCSPVTIADIGAQAIILSYLEPFSNCHIIAEEDSSILDKIASTIIEDIISMVIPLVSGKFKTKLDFQSFKDLLDGKKEKNTTSEYYFTIDPVDGTKGFIRGDQYSICLSLLSYSNHKVLASVVVCPKLPCYSWTSSSTGTIFYAISGGGSFEISIQEYDSLKDLSSLSLKSKKNFVIANDLYEKKIKICRSYESSHSSPESIQEYFFTHFNNELEVEYLELDSQCKYGLIARGDAHAYIRLKPYNSNYMEKIWDHAPGQLLVIEAGGHVCMSSRLLEPIFFTDSPELPFNDGIIALNSYSLIKMNN